MHGEGVIKFEASHRHEALDPRRHGEVACKLVAWREIFHKLGLVGQRPELYEGAGYGNVSARVGPPGLPRQRRTMLVTGTQTGGLASIHLEHMCLVERWDFEANRVESRGPVLPSSESLTHGAIYDLSPAIRFVFHAHAPALWRSARELGIPTTDPAIAYGTPAMARAVQRLFRESQLAAARILAMGGHEDGVVVFGASAEDAGEVLVGQLARAYELACRAPERTASGAALTTRS